jgi:creatinine amidohydrolase
MIPRFEMLERRAFAALTTAEVAKLDPDRTVPLLVVASVEQHGPHLPLLTDSIIAQTNLNNALAKADPDLPLYALPALCYGKSNEHNRFPGTISLRASTLMEVLRDIAASLARAGLKKLVFINGHGGNPQVLDMMARDLREEYGLLIFPLHPGMRFGMPEGVRAPHERGMGIHGGEIETSMMLAAVPDLVHMELAKPSISTVLDSARYLTLEGNIAFGWLSEDIAASGVMGDPTGATVEKGRIVLDSISAQLAAVLEEIVDFQLRPGV